MLPSMANDTTTPSAKHEGLKIGARLQELGASLGLNQRQLALRSGIDPRHFNSFWNDRRTASFEVIVKVAHRTGRSVAWVCGEEEARPQIGIADAIGRVTMSAQTMTAGVIYFAEASGPFPAGTRLFVDPSDAFVVGKWMLLRTRARPDETWLAWGQADGGIDFVQRSDGEVFRYHATRHEVLGVVAGMLMPPPSPLSA